MFQRRALANGIEPDQIHLEERSTNFGENIAFVRELMPQLRRVIFVTKKSMNNLNMLSGCAARHHYFVL